MAQQTCFVIMPFSKTDSHTQAYWTSHYKDFLVPRIEAVQQLQAERARALRGDILRDIIASLVSSPIVVADLTDANPNVYWELGVRQSFHHGTITIAEFGTKIPFDISGKGHLWYYPDDMHKTAAEFEPSFREALEDCVTNPERPDSAVLESISGRGSLYSVINREANLRRLNALQSEIQANASLYDRIKARIVANDSIRNAEAQAKTTSEATTETDSETTMVTTARLRMASVELFMTSRYLDVPPEIYREAEHYFDYLVTINGQVSRWSSGESDFEEWFTRNEKHIRPSFQEFETNIVALNDRLSGE